MIPRNETHAHRALRNLPTRERGLEVTGRSGRAANRRGRIEGDDKRWTTSGKWFAERARTDDARWSTGDKGAARVASRDDAKEKSSYGGRVFAKRKNIIKKKNLHKKTAS